MIFVTFVHQVIVPYFVHFFLLIASKSSHCLLNLLHGSSTLSWVHQSVILCFRFFNCLHWFCFDGFIMIEVKFSYFMVWCQERMWLCVGILKVAAFGCFSQIFFIPAWGQGIIIACVFKISVSHSWAASFSFVVGVEKLGHTISVTAFFACVFTGEILNSIVWLRLPIIIIKSLHHLQGVQM